MKKYFILLFCIIINYATLVSQEINLEETIPSRNYNLKGNYKLSICDEVKDNHIYKIILSKNGTNIIIEENTYFNNLKYYPRYENVDFDDYFIVQYFMGDVSYCLYEKKTGIKILEFHSRFGNNSLFNIDNQLLIYNETDETDAVFPSGIYLYDLKNEKKYKLNEFLRKEQAKNLFWLNILNWRDSFKFGKVTSQNIEIIFHGCYKPIFDGNGEFIDTENYKFSFVVDR